MPTTLLLAHPDLKSQRHLCTVVVEVKTFFTFIQISSGHTVIVQIACEIAELPLGFQIRVG